MSCPGLLRGYLVASPAAGENTSTLCLDEPENFLALPEIQPWLVALHDRCSGGEVQALQLLTPVIRAVGAVGDRAPYAAGPDLAEVTIATRPPIGRRTAIAGHAVHIDVGRIELDPSLRG